MDPMPHKDTVWMVHLRTGLEPIEVKGTIRLQDDGLEFEDARTAAVSRFPYAQTRRVRRLRASPVLMVEWTAGDERRRTAFYFVQPPPLHPAEDTLPGAGSDGRPPSPFTMFRGSGKRKHTRTNAAYLTTQAGSMRERIQAWADEVSKRMEGRD
jgi:hypothetical protein